MPLPAYMPGSATLSFENLGWPTLPPAEGLGAEGARRARQGWPTPLQLFPKALGHQGGGAAEPVAEAELGGLDPRRMDD